MDIITRKQFTRFADFNFPNYTVKTSCIRDPRNELGLTFFHLLPLFHYFHSFPLKYIPHISLHLLHLYSFTYIENEKFTTECLDWCFDNADDQWPALPRDISQSARITRNNSISITASSNALCFAEISSRLRRMLAAL